jgi:hypothetical protein
MVGEWWTHQKGIHMADPTPSTNGNLPEPTEEYQRKLRSYIADIPALGGPEIVSGTPPLKNPSKQADIDALKDKLKTDAKFKKYTGYEHKSLLEKWLTDKTTTCNEFCQRCAVAMGYTSQDGVGRFDIADRLLSRGLGHVWVPASSNATPEYGDIFRLYEPNPDHNKVPLNHMAVSLYVSGGDWYTVESGQGGPSRGQDAILRKKRSWKPSSLRGWVSIKALLHADKPLPYWLGGWWQVEEAPNDTNYYYFAAGGKVNSTTTKPLFFTNPPGNASLVGSFVVKGLFDLEISWRSADPPETLRIVVQEQKKRNFIMEGKTSKGAKLKATRLIGKDPFA